MAELIGSATSGNLYGQNYSPNGVPSSAGDNAIQVDRPNEGLSGVYTTTNNGSSFVATRGNFDTSKAIGYAARQVCQIDTSGTSGNPVGVDVTRAYPTTFRSAYQL
jgi:hypothetical protein